MIVPLMKRSGPGDGTRPARQTASFTTDSGQRRTMQLSRAEEFVVEDFVGDLLMTYVFDLPRYFRHVNRKDCLDFGAGPGHDPDNRNRGSRWDRAAGTRDRDGLGEIRAAAAAFTLCTGQAQQVLACL